MNFDIQEFWNCSKWNTEEYKHVQRILWTAATNGSKKINGIVTTNLKLKMYFYELVVKITFKMFSWGILLNLPKNVKRHFRKYNLKSGTELMKVRI